MPDLDHLLQMWRSADADVRDAEIARREVVKDIEAEFIRLGQEAIEQNITPQTFAEGPGVEVTYKSKTEYAKALDGPLRTLAEVMDPVAFEKLLTKQAEPKPPPPRTFNMTKVKPLEERGGEYARAIAAARITHPPQAVARSVE
jgi:hypothetical protein